jgi:hypothetical protein
MAHTSPILVLPRPRAILVGGQSDKSARWPSRVWITIIPSLRARSSTLRVGSMVARSGETSLPSASPNPPGSTKSRCMSMISRAVLARSPSNS